jgi:hypothetical protein
MGQVKSLCSAIWPASSERRERRRQQRNSDSLQWFQLLVCLDCR